MTHRFLLVLTFNHLDILICAVHMHVCMCGGCVCVCRTIITGICYLATFVFAANSIGLTLYSLQLALNLDPPSSSPTNDSIDKKRELLSDSPSSEEERSPEQEQR